MTAVETILQYLYQFLERLLDILGTNLTPEATEGIVALFCIGIIIRLVDVGPRIPKRIFEKIIKKNDDEEWVLVKR